MLYQKVNAKMGGTALFFLLLMLQQQMSYADDITDQVFGEFNSFLPAAFGDFNSDKHTDIFIINKNETSNTCSVEVLKAYQDPPLLRPDGPSCACPSKNVISVVPGDFDGDGALDAVFLAVNEGLYDVFIAYGNLTHFLCPTDKIMTLTGEPLMMDFNGDMIADLFGEDSNKTRTYYLFDETRSPPKSLPMIDEFDPELKSLPALKLPSSHGFVDLDGDLAADLFVTAKGQFEIWKNTATGFKLTEKIPVPSWATVVGQTAFMDIALDGTLEPVTVMCRNADCSDGQVYVYTTLANSTEGQFVPVGPTLTIDKKVYSFPSQQDHPTIYTDVITLRVADHDLDGYPDLLITLLNSNGKPQVFLARNSPCEDDTCSFKRKFVLAPDLFKDFPNSIMATYFDFFENGRVDILLIYENPKASGKYIAAAVSDPQQYDAMFLKVLVPSGRCYSECAHRNIPYGTSPAGPTFRYSITTSDRSMQVSVATQLSQSAHMVMQLPFTLFGLGRNWNFVETLEVALPVKNLPNRANEAVAVDIPNEALHGAAFPSIRNFTQIIPNSQVIVIPYPISQPEAWLNKLYITPSKALKLTAAALVGVCTLVACVIAVLHWREKKEDKKEKLQQAQAFHFDAM